MEPGTSKHRAGVPRYPIVAGHHHASTADFSAHATVSRAKARLAQAEQGEQRAQKEPPAAAAEAASHSTGSAPSLIPQGNMPSALKVQGSPKPAGENLHDYLERMETILAEVQAEHSEVVARSRPVLTTVPEHDGRLDDRSTGTQSPLGQDLNMSDWYGYNPMSSVTLEMTTSDTSVDESFGDMVLMASPIKGATGRMGFSTPTRRIPAAQTPTDELATPARAPMTAEQCREDSKAGQAAVGRDPASGADGVPAECASTLLVARFLASPHAGLLSASDSIASHPVDLDSSDDALSESSVVSQANSPLYDHTRYEGSSSESATSTPRDALVPLVHKKQSSVTAISIVASVPLLDSLPGPPAMTSIRHETGHAIRPGEHATATPAVFAEPAPVSPKKQAILQLRARRLHTRIADVRYSLRTSTALAKASKVTKASGRPFTAPFPEPVDAADDRSYQEAGLELRLAQDTASAQQERWLGSIEQQAATPESASTSYAPAHEASHIHESQAKDGAGRGAAAHLEPPAQVAEVRPGTSGGLAKRREYALQRLKTRALNRHQLSLSANLHHSSSMPVANGLAQSAASFSSHTQSLAPGLQIDTDLQPDSAQHSRASTQQEAREQLLAEYAASQHVDREAFARGCARMTAVIEGSMVRQRLRQRACRGLCSEILEMQALLLDVQQRAGAAGADALLARQLEQQLRMRRTQLADMLDASAAPPASLPITKPLLKLNTQAAPRTSDAGGENAPQLHHKRPASAKPAGPSPDPSMTGKRAAPEPPSAPALHTPVHAVMRRPREDHGAEEDHGFTTPSPEGPQAGSEEDDGSAKPFLKRRLPKVSVTQKLNWSEVKPKTKCHLEREYIPVRRNQPLRRTQSSPRSPPAAAYSDTPTREAMVFSSTAPSGAFALASREPFHAGDPAHLTQGGASRQPWNSNRAQPPVRQSSGSKFMGNRVRQSPMYRSSSYSPAPPAASSQRSPPAFNTSNHASTGTTVNGQGAGGGGSGGGGHPGPLDDILGQVTELLTQVNDILGR
ncbi:hypothetical protein WJX72_009384 [[Myrmecia] bisecta]|uniref:Uncharacterized protein n=1 Tax=[Myrmecia] bisecta TaxID=41462 RepID=A0AAW1R914_9CHLO